MAPPREPALAAQPWRTTGGSCVRGEGDTGAGRAAEGASWTPDEAVTALYTAHYRSLLRCGALLLGDAALTEEVVQDAFVPLHHNWRRLRDTVRALAYLRA